MGVGPIKQDPELSGTSEVPGGPPNEKFVRLRKLHARAHSNPVSAFATKILLTLIGLALIAVGLIMLFTPGQGILAVVAGLAVLSLEYAWAQRLLKRSQDRLQEARDRARAMDPKVRRRRIVVTSLSVGLVGTAIVAYLLVYDWPHLAVRTWDRLQEISRFVPELPGM
jgi:uncharacterized protein (TIGR02611 family)